MSQQDSNTVDSVSGFGSSLALFRRLSSQTVASSFQTQSRDQFGAMVYNRSNATIANLSTPLGANAVASGNRSTAIGAFANAKEDSSTALGIYAQAFGPSSVAIGDQARATAYRSIAIGPLALAKGIRALSFGIQSSAIGPDSTAIGQGAVASSGTGSDVAIGNSAQATGGRSVAIGPSSTSGDRSVAIGYSSHVTGGFSEGIGSFTTVAANESIVIGNSGNNTNPAWTDSLAIGFNAFTDAAHQATFGSGLGYFSEYRIFVGADLQRTTITTSTELLTIAAAPSTATTIQIPASVILKFVSVRTVTVIPTAVTYTVTGNTSGTVFDTAAVSTAANSTDKGNAAGAFYNATAQTVRITPNVNPAAGTGQVRVTICYEDVIPPIS